MQEGEAQQLADDDPRKILGEELGYLERNQGRKDYPSYRQRGLPWTSSHVESTVKLFNRRVKGSEKFWPATGAEAILQVRLHSSSKTTACPASQDPAVHPYRNYKTRENRQAA